MGARVRSPVYVSITTSSMGVIIWVNYEQNPLDCGKSLFLPELCDCDSVSVVSGNLGQVTLCCGSSVVELHEKITHQI